VKRVLIFAEARGVKTKNVVMVIAAAVFAAGLYFLMDSGIAKPSASIDIDLYETDQTALHTFNFCQKNHYEPTLKNFGSNNIAFHAFTNEDGYFVIRAKGKLKNPVVFDIVFSRFGHFIRLEADNGTAKGQIFPITVFNTKVE